MFNTIAALITATLFGKNRNVHTITTAAKKTFCMAPRQTSHSGMYSFSMIDAARKKNQRNKAQRRK